MISEDTKKVEAEIRGLLSNSSDAVEIAHQTLEQVNQVSQRAQTTLSVWQNELQKALAWQARAEERLARANQEYKRAQRNLVIAQQEFASAESSLRRCMNDPKRKSCSGEERAYNNARAAVAVALQELQMAEIEVRAAEEELERAKARVRCCQQAVGYAQQAVQHANLAIEQANQALNEAERSLESAKAANRSITKASKNATKENELVHQAIGQVKQAEGFVTQSEKNLQVAINKADSAYCLAIQGNQELAYRRDQLVRLNQVDSSLSSVSPSTYASSSNASTPTSSPSFKFQYVGYSNAISASSEAQSKIEAKSALLKRNLGNPTDNKIPSTDINYPDGKYEAHHVIPGECADKSDLVRTAIALGFDIDSAINGIYLPQNEETQSLIRDTTNIELPLHSGYHKSYNHFIDNILEMHWQDINGNDHLSEYFLNQNDPFEVKVFTVLERAIDTIKSLMVKAVLDTEDMYKGKKSSK